MQITAIDLGKRYNRQWIFKDLNCKIQSGEMVAITGHNGSGKSTLLKILSGFLGASKGCVEYGDSIEDIQTQFAFAAPYVNLIAEFTLSEHLAFHRKFKNTLMSDEEILDKSGLSQSRHKLVKDFSSGMQQRLRLALAFFFDAKIIFLDEPTTNLDAKGTNWYLNLLKERHENQTIVIASNQPVEYQGAHQSILIENFL